MKHFFLCALHIDYTAKCSKGNIACMYLSVCVSVNTLNLMHLHRGNKWWYGLVRVSDLEYLAKLAERTELEKEV
ncbi:unnamed protein product [Brugia timori]|uniref:CBS domain-containing protein n=1 Tax=Brugia timori TaxID=42155 RepID=A0A0R3R769_9BILA|nr:unnamed protein product [Brugia timori]